MGFHHARLLSQRSRYCALFSETETLQKRQSLVSHQCEAVSRVPYRQSPKVCAPPLLGPRTRSTALHHSKRGPMSPYKNALAQNR